MRLVNATQEETDAAATTVVDAYAALRNGMSPRDRIEDAPLEIDGWSPENFDGRFRGRVSLAEAFARSLKCCHGAART